jgi:hypothetical protein
MYEQHICEAHPEVAQVGRLIERIDRLIMLLENAMDPLPGGWA